MKTLSGEVRRLAKAGATLAVAESCTGGMLSVAITALPGVSTVFMGGVVCYANSVKERVLGVPRKTLESHGAVSTETATAMAEGVCRILQAEAGVAITGIAGPGGAVPGKPVGTVYIAAHYANHTTVRRFHFRGTRAQVRRSAAIAAATLLRKSIKVAQVF